MTQVRNLGPQLRVLWRLDFFHNSPRGDTHMLQIRRDLLEGRPYGWVTIPASVEQVDQRSAGEGRPR